MGGLKAYRLLVLPMRRLLSIIVLSLMVMSSVPQETHLEGDKSVHFVDSPLSFSFTNGPAAAEEIKGVKTLTFNVNGGNDENISSMVLEIQLSDGSWSEVRNLTESPWLVYFDSTQYANGSYQLRVRGWDHNVSNHTDWTISNQFSIVNQEPVITQFTLEGIAYGDGSTSSNRAWLSTPLEGDLNFSWSVLDDDLSHASLGNTPGSGSVPDDGPGTLNYAWSWSPGDIQEGTYNPRLTVYDYSGFQVSDTLFIGIDRTPPTMTAPTIGNGESWQNQEEVTISSIMSSAEDGSGSGIAEVMLNYSDTWTSINDETYTLNLNDGETILGFKPIDNVGNQGEEIQVVVNVDTLNPEGISWTVDTLTTSNDAPVNVSFSAFDAGSGIDDEECQIQYGFDANGIGAIPDLGGWQNAPETGLETTAGSNNWITKSRQYLMLRAVLVDQAGNEFTTIPAAYQILPGLDLSWNITSTNVDRLVVRPSSSSEDVVISSEITSNEVYGGSVMVHLEAAPADRNSQVEWTNIETRLIPAGSFANQTHAMTWNYSVPEAGQWDLRLVIDPTNLIDEFDEGNNAHYMMVTGASVNNPGTVPSFAPSILGIIGVGFLIAWIQRKK